MCNGEELILRGQPTLREVLWNILVMNEVPVDVDAHLAEVLGSRMSPLSIYQPPLHQPKQATYVCAL